MKLVIGLLVSFAAVSGFAQTAVLCTNAQIKKEARDFLAVQDIHGSNLEFVQDCLKAAISKEASYNKSKTARTTRSKVLDVLAAIKHDDMVGLIKCETSEVPAPCLQEKDDSQIFSKEDEQLLERDADAKNKAIQEERESGSRDW